MTELFRTFLDAFDEIADLRNDKDFKKRVAEVRAACTDPSEVIIKESSCRKRLPRNSRDRFFENRNFRTDVMGTNKSHRRIFEASLKPIPEDSVILETPDFLKDVKHLKFTEDDIAELKKELTKRPPRACVGSSIYKFDFWPSRYNLSPSEGRVIYFVKTTINTILLLRAYHKNKVKNLSKGELDILRKKY